MEQTDNDNFMECAEEIEKDLAGDEQPIFQSEYKVPSIPYSSLEMQTAESIN